MISTMKWQAIWKPKLTKLWLYFVLCKYEKDTRQMRRKEHDISCIKQIINMEMAIREASKWYSISYFYSTLKDKVTAINKTEQKISNKTIDISGTYKNMFFRKIFLFDIILQFIKTRKLYILFKNIFKNIKILAIFIFRKIWYEKALWHKNNIS